LKKLHLVFEATAQNHNYDGFNSLVKFRILPLWLPLTNEPFSANGCQFLSYSNVAAVGYVWGYALHQ
jgi:hypothetical protein